MDKDKKKYKKVFKIFLVNQSEEEEKWLGEMSKQGYHLINVTFFNYIFKVGENKEYRYIIDLMDKDQKDIEYTNMYEDYGFEYIDSILGFAYFRIENNEESIKIINSDKGRKFSQYKHYSKTLLLIAITNIVIFFINSFIINPISWARPIYEINLIAALLVLWSYIGLKNKIKVLKLQIQLENKEALNDVNLYEWEKLKKLNTVFMLLIAIMVILAVIKIIL